MEKYEGDSSRVLSTPGAALQDIIQFGLRISNMEAITGMNAPTVIT